MSESFFRGTAWAWGFVGLDRWNRRKDQNAQVSTKLINLRASSLAPHVPINQSEISPLAIPRCSRPWLVKFVQTTCWFMRTSEISPSWTRSEMRNRKMWVTFASPSAIFTRNALKFPSGSSVIIARSDFPRLSHSFSTPNVLSSSVWLWISALLVGFSSLARSYSFSVRVLFDFQLRGCVRKIPHKQKVRKGFVSP